MSVFLNKTFICLIFCLSLFIYNTFVCLSPYCFKRGVGSCDHEGLGIDVCSTCTSEMLVVVFPFSFFSIFLFQTRLRQNQNQRQHEATSFTTISYLEIIENIGNKKGCTVCICNI